MRSLIAVFLTAATTALSSVLAFGQSSSTLPARTFVSTKGTDSGACGSTAPCRTFSYAFSQTRAGGEITVLDSGGYGPLTINKSISIANPSSIAGISIAGGTAIYVDGASTDKVVLRGLTLDGGGLADSGVLVKNGSVSVVNCLIKNFASYAIWLQAGSMFIVGTTVTDSNYGIYMSTNGFGSIKSSIIQNSTNSGIIIDLAGTFIIDEVSSIKNGWGLYAGNGTILVSRSTFVGNLKVGVETLGSANILSYRDNRINGNALDTKGPINTATLQ